MKLTAELEHQILAYIRLGAFPHVAAQAAGVPRATWDDWLRRGRAKRAQPPYKSLPAKVEQAEAIARVQAELEVFKTDPRFWLKNGPGRETADEKGWAAMVRPILQGPIQNINVFSSPDFLGFLARLRQILAPHPELLAAIA